MARTSRVVGEKANRNVMVRLTETEYDKLVYLQIAKKQKSLADTFRFLLINDPVVCLARVDSWSDDSVVVSKSEIENLVIEIGPEKAKVQLVQRLYSWCAEYIEKNGWFYPTNSQCIDDVITEVRQLATVGSVVTATAINNKSYFELSNLSRCGVSYLKANFRSFWNTYRGPVALTRSPKRFQTFLGNVLGFYTDQTEHKDVTLNLIRRKMAVLRFTVSFFKPVVAAEIYKAILGNAERPTVWDPSCGFGARLLGFAAMYPNGTYIGNEPAEATLSDLNSLRAKLPTSLCVQLIQKGSEIWAPPADTVDIVFTSPPYFHKEKYFAESSQSWVMYKTEDEWKSKFLFVTLTAALRATKSGGYIVYNTDHVVGAWVREWASRQGATIEMFEGQLINREFVTTRTASIKGRKVEPILVMRVNKEKSEAGK